MSRIRGTVSALVLTAIAMSGCSKKGGGTALLVGTSPDYPPFTFLKKGELQGFEVDLIKKIAKELGKEVVFEHMQFSAIFPALAHGKIDIAFGGIGVSEKRKERYDFVGSYAAQSLVLVVSKKSSIHKIADLSGKTIGIQMGTLQEEWANEHLTKSTRVPMGVNTKAIEALKAGHIDGVLLDKAPAKSFCEKNEGLHFIDLGKADRGFSIAFPKGSDLAPEVQKVLEKLEKEGIFQKLQQKWLNE